MNPHLKIIQDEITALMRACPDLVEDEILREDMIVGETSVDSFITNVVRKIGNTRALISGTADYVRELNERMERLEERERALRGLIQRILISANLRKMELPEATVSLRQNPAKVIIVDEKEIPQDFWRVKREPDKVKIGAALRAHEAVPGTCLGNPETSLMVRV